MRYELHKSFFFWRWSVTHGGKGVALTKAGAKRSAEALIEHLKRSAALSLGVSAPRR